MSNVKTAIGEELKRLLNEVWLVNEDNPVVAVTDWREEEQSGGYCETCYYEEVVVYIDYVRQNGTEDYYMYYGSMAELISVLTDK